ncbi:polysaccharide biosynthesis tyrosine autokinase [Streptomyces sp. NPDC048172]|uniref:polysaccharide biosynthesis tyrosine autokinase n=1 Tax=Streptomyces sp. NPDC048172 TaxID=3365505 RepID=UPI00371D6E40
MTRGFRGFPGVLARRWRTVAALALAGLLAGGVAALTASAAYEASTRVLYSPGGDGSAGSARERVRSYAGIVASPRFTAPVVRELRLDESPDAVAGRVRARAVPGTSLLDITVTHGDPHGAARLANAVAAEFGAQMAKLEGPARSRPAPVVAKRATPPGAPVSRDPVLTVLAGVFLGLCAGLVAALVRDRRDTAPRTVADLADATGLPVLGAVPYDPDTGRAPLACLGDPYGERAEAHRVIRAATGFARGGEGARLLVVTSALPGEGKSATAADLAAAFAEGGASVCLVEADLRRPRIAAACGLVREAGLTTVLIGRAELDEVLQRPAGGALSVLAAGPLPPNPAELLASERTARLLAELRARFDVVVLDTAPLLNVADTTGLLPSADGCLLAVRAGATPRARVAEAVAAVRAVGTPLAGAVLTMADLGSDRRYGYGNGRAAKDRPVRPEMALPHAGQPD